MKKTYKNQLPKGMEVKGTNVSVENGEIIVSVELEKKFEPKGGDFLYCNNCGVFVYKKTIYSDCCDAYCGVDCKGKINLGLYSPYWCKKHDCRYSTPEEKAAFLARLEKECGKRWNAEKKT